MCCIDTDFEREVAPKNSCYELKSWRHRGILSFYFQDINPRSRSRYFNHRKGILALCDYFTIVLDKSILIANEIFISWRYLKTEALFMILLDQH
jgi:hypothetical protein